MLLIEGLAHSAYPVSVFVEEGLTAHNLCGDTSRLSMALAGQECIELSQYLGRAEE